MYMQRPLAYIENEGGIIEVSETLGANIGSLIGHLIYYCLIPVLATIPYTTIIIMEQLKKIKKVHLIAIAEYLGVHFKKEDTVPIIEDKIVNHIDDVEPEEPDYNSDILNFSSALDALDDVHVDPENGGITYPKEVDDVYFPEEEEVVIPESLVESNTDEIDWDEEPELTEEQIVYLTKAHVYPRDYDAREFFTRREEIQDIYCRYLKEWFNLEPSFDQYDLKQAYRNSVSKHHPDNGGDSELFGYMTEFYKEMLDKCFDYVPGSRAKVILSPNNPIAIEIKPIQYRLDLEAYEAREVYYKECEQYREDEMKRMEEEITPERALYREKLRKESEEEIEQLRREFNIQ